MLSFHYFREILYFASEVLGSHFTWFRCKSSTQHPDNRAQRAQCSKFEYITGMSWIWQRSISSSGWQRNKDVFVKGNSFYNTSWSISATKSALCTLLIDPLRLHRCRRIYSFTQAIPTGIALTSTFLCSLKWSSYIRCYASFHSLLPDHYFLWTIRIHCIRIVVWCVERSRTRSVWATPYFVTVP